MTKLDEESKAKCLALADQCCHDGYLAPKVVEGFYREAYAAGMKRAASELRRMQVLCERVAAMPYADKRLRDRAEVLHHIAEWFNQQAEALVKYGHK